MFWENEFYGIETDRDGYICLSTHFPMKTVCLPPEYFEIMFGEYLKQVKGE